MELPRDNDGKLIAYAWPGGYPVFYVSRDDQRQQYVLCVTHANDLERDNAEEVKRAEESDDEDDMAMIAETIVAYDVNWEDDELYCESCSDGRPNQRIPSAYGENETEDTCAGY